MQRIQFKDYLRSNQLHREVSVAVRYAKDTPRKAELLRQCGRFFNQLWPRFYAINGAAAELLEKQVVQDKAQIRFAV